MRYADGAIAATPPDIPPLIDPFILARAEAAFAHVFARWQGLIEAVKSDRSLSPDRRAAAVIALRYYQRLEAEGARKRVLDEAPKPKRPRMKKAPSQKPEHE